MNYQEFINSIIDTRGQWSDEVRYSDRGCDRHHIVPKCIGGEPLKLNWEHHENIIWLYPAEHFIAHRLLAEENNDVEGLVCAYKRMCYSKSGKYIVTPEDFELAENLFRKTHSTHIKGKKHPHHIIKDKEAYSKQKSEQTKGAGNPMYGKGYLLSGGKNGHAIRNFYYKDLFFDCMKDMINYINSTGLHITRTAVMTLVSGKATNKLYKMYGDIIKDIKWEYKDENKISKGC